MCMPESKLIKKKEVEYKINYKHLLSTATTCLSVSLFLRSLPSVALSSLRLYKGKLNSF